MIRCLKQLFIKNKYYTRKCKLRFGELIVTGTDYLEIKIGKFYPEAVFIQFKCDRENYNDKLSWRIKRSNSNNYSIIINWKVNDIRNIQWFAYY